MLEDHVKKDIEKISLDLLKHSKAFDAFPTPVDQILHYANLRVNRDTDLFFSVRYYRGGLNNTNV